MNNPTAKEILSAYRSNGADANDENFRGALDQCRNDPTMENWLKEEQRFDAEITTLLKSIPVPVEGKDGLLRKPLIDGNSCFKEDAKIKPFLSLGKWMTAGGIAALFLFGVLLWQFSIVSNTIVEGDSFRVSNLVSQSMPLSYISDDTDSIVNWLSNRNAPVPIRFPDALSGVDALGCRVFNTPGGGKISLLCLSINGEIVHFFVFDETSSQLLAYAPLEEWWEESDYSMYSYQLGPYRIALATQGTKQII